QQVVAVAAGVAHVARHQVRHEPPPELRAHHGGLRVEQPLVDGADDVRVLVRAQHPGQRLRRHVLAHGEDQRVVEQRTARIDEGAVVAVDDQELVGLDAIVAADEVVEDDAAVAVGVVEDGGHGDSFVGRRCSPKAAARMLRHVNGPGAAGAPPGGLPPPPPVLRYRVPMPSPTTLQPSVSTLDAAALDELRAAHALLETPGLAAQLANLVGAPLEYVMEKRLPAPATK